MNTPDDLHHAHHNLAVAAARARHAEVRTILATRPGLAYAAVDDERTLYLVSYDGRIIGKLHHPAGSGAVANWHAHPDADPSNELGPFRTGRQAATALLSTMTPTHR